MAEVVILSLIVTCLRLAAIIFNTLEQAYDVSQEFKNVPGAIRNLILDIQAAQGCLQNIQLTLRSHGPPGNGDNQDNRILVNNIEGAHLSLEIISAFATKHVSSIKSYKFTRYIIYMVQHAEIIRHRDDLRNRLVYLRMLQDMRYGTLPYLRPHWHLRKLHFLSMASQAADRVDVVDPIHKVVTTPAAIRAHLIQGVCLQRPVLSTTTRSCMDSQFPHVQVRPGIPAGRKDTFPASSSKSQDAGT